MAVEFNNPVRDPKYYLNEPSSIEPKFEGKAASILGMEWSEKAYLNLYAGYTTDDQGNRQTMLPDYIKGNRRGAIGITFSLPKNPSLAKELGGDTRIDDVMTRAREAAMREVERQFYVRSPFEQTGNLIWTTFRHSGSREGDPHSHDHVIIANLSLSKAKGRDQWKAIEMRYLDYAGIAKVYNDTLRQGFNELGYKTKAAGKEFDIVGVPSEVKGIFSKRHNAIQATQKEMEEKTGKPMGTKAKGKLSVYNRPEKPDHMPPPERKAKWLSQLTEGQAKAVQGVVAKARLMVTRSRWTTQVAKHAQRLKSYVLRPDDSRDRSKDSGRTR